MNRMLCWLLLAVMAAGPAMGQVTGQPIAPVVPKTDIHPAPTPPPPPTASVSLTMDEMQLIAVSLNKAASACSEDRDACKIGLYKGEVIAKMQAAADSLQPKPKK